MLQKTPASCVRNIAALLLIAVYCCIVSAAVEELGTEFTEHSFANWAKDTVPPTFSLVGSAHQIAHRIQLTTEPSGQAGAAWYGTTSIQNGFDSSFTFVTDGIGAASLAFVLQTTVPNAIGNEGGERGFIPFENSISVAFDVSHLSPYYNYVQLYGSSKNGLMNIESTPLNAALDSGQHVQVRVVYVPGSFKVFVNGELRINRNDFTHSVWTGDQDVYVGFTAATGEQSASQAITSFAMSVLHPVSVSAPLLATGKRKLHGIAEPEAPSSWSPLLFVFVPPPNETRADTNIAMVPSTEMKWTLTDFNASLSRFTPDTHYFCLVIDSESAQSVVNADIVSIYVDGGVVYSTLQCNLTASTFNVLNTSIWVNVSGEELQLASSHDVYFVHQNAAIGYVNSNVTQLSTSLSSTASVYLSAPQLPMKLAEKVRCMQNSNLDNTTQVIDAGANQFSCSVSVPSAADTGLQRVSLWLAVDTDLVEIGSNQLNYVIVSPITTASSSDTFLDDVNANVRITANLNTQLNYGSPVKYWCHFRNISVSESGSNTVTTSANLIANSNTVSKFTCALGDQISGGGELFTVTMAMSVEDNPAQHDIWNATPIAVYYTNVGTITTDSRIILRDQTVNLTFSTDTLDTASATVSFQCVDQITQTAFEATKIDKYTLNCNTTQTTALVMHLSARMRVDSHLPAIWHNISTNIVEVLVMEPVSSLTSNALLGVVDTPRQLTVSCANVVPEPERQHVFCKLGSQLFPATPMVTAESYRCTVTVATQSQQPLRLVYRDPTTHKEIIFSTEKTFTALKRGEITYQNIYGTFTGSFTLQFVTTLVKWDGAQYYCRHLNGQWLERSSVGYRVDGVDMMNATFIINKSTPVQFKFQLWASVSLDQVQLTTQEVYVYVMRPISALTVVNGIQSYSTPAQPTIDFQGNSDFLTPEQYTDDLFWCRQIHHHNGTEYFSVAKRIADNRVRCTLAKVTETTRVEITLYFKLGTDMFSLLQPGNPPTPEPAYITFIRASTSDESFSHPSTALMSVAQQPIHLSLKIQFHYDEARPAPGSPTQQFLCEYHDGSQQAVRNSTMTLLSYSYNGVDMPVEFSCPLPGNGFQSATHSLSVSIFILINEQKLPISTRTFTIWLIQPMTPTWNVLSSTNSTEANSPALVDIDWIQEQFLINRTVCRQNGVSVGTAHVQATSATFQCSLLATAIGTHNVTLWFVDEEDAVEFQITSGSLPFVFYSQAKIKNPVIYTHAASSTIEITTNLDPSNHGSQASYSVGVSAGSTTVYYPSNLETEADGSSKFSFTVSSNTPSVMQVTVFVTANNGDKQAITQTMKLFFITPVAMIYESDFRATTNLTTSVIIGLPFTTDPELLSHVRCVQNGTRVQTTQIGSTSSFQCSLASQVNTPGRIGITMVFLVDNQETPLSSGDPEYFVFAVPGAISLADTIITTQQSTVTIDAAISGTAHYGDGHRFYCRFTNMSSGAAGAVFLVEAIPNALQAQEASSLYNCELNSDDSEILSLELLLETMGTELTVSSGAQSIYIIKKVTIAYNAANTLTATNATSYSALIDVPFTTHTLMRDHVQCYYNNKVQNPIQVLSGSTYSCTTSFDSNDIGIGTYDFMLSINGVTEPINNNALTFVHFVPPTKSEITPTAARIEPHPAVVTVITDFKYSGIDYGADAEFYCNIQSITDSAPVNTSVVDAISGDALGTNFTCKLYSDVSRIYSISLWVNTNGQHVQLTDGLEKQNLFSFIAPIAPAWAASNVRTVGLIDILHQAHISLPFTTSSTMCNRVYCRADTNLSTHWNIPAIVNNALGSEFNCPLQHSNSGFVHISLWYYDGTTNVEISTERLIFVFFSMASVNSITPTAAYVGSEEVVLRTTFVTENINYGPISYICRYDSLSDQESIKMNVASLASHESGTNFTCPMSSDRSRLYSVAVMIRFDNEDVQIVQNTVRFVFINRTSVSYSPVNTLRASVGDSYNATLHAPWADDQLLLSMTSCRQNNEVVQTWPSSASIVCQLTALANPSLVNVSIWFDDGTTQLEIGSNQLPFVFVKLITASTSTSTAGYVPNGATELATNFLLKNVNYGETPTFYCGIHGAGGLIPAVVQSAVVGATNYTCSFTADVTTNFTYDIFINVNQQLLKVSTDSHYYYLIKQVNAVYDEANIERATTSTSSFVTINLPIADCSNEILNKIACYQDGLRIETVRNGTHCTSFRCTVAHAAKDGIVNITMMYNDQVSLLRVSNNALPFVFVESAPIHSLSMIQKHTPIATPLLNTFFKLQSVNYGSTPEFYCKYSSFFSNVTYNSTASVISSSDTGTIFSCALQSSVSKQFYVRLLMRVNGQLLTVSTNEQVFTFIRITPASYSEHNTAGRASLLSTATIRISVPFANDPTLLNEAICKQDNLPVPTSQNGTDFECQLGSKGKPGLTAVTLWFKDWLIISENVIPFVFVNPSKTAIMTPTAGLTPSAAIDLKTDFAYENVNYGDGAIFECQYNMTTSDTVMRSQAYITSTTAQSTTFGCLLNSTSSEVVRISLGIVTNNESVMTFTDNDRIFYILERGNMSLHHSNLASFTLSETFDFVTLLDNVKAFALPFVRCSQGVNLMKTAHYDQPNVVHCHLASTGGAYGMFRISLWFDDGNTQLRLTDNDLPFVFSRYSSLIALDPSVLPINSNEQLNIITDVPLANYGPLAAYHCRLQGSDVNDIFYAPATTMQSSWGLSFTCYVSSNTTKTMTATVFMSVGAEEYQIVNEQQLSFVNGSIVTYYGGSPQAAYMSQDTNVTVLLSPLSLVGNPYNVVCGQDTDGFVMYPTYFNETGDNTFRCVIHSNSTQPLISFRMWRVSDAGYTLLSANRLLFVFVERAHITDLSPFAALRTDLEQRVMVHTNYTYPGDSASVMNFRCLFGNENSPASYEVAADQSVSFSCGLSSQLAIMYTIQIAVSVQSTQLPLTYNTDAFKLMQTANTTFIGSRLRLVNNSSYGVDLTLPLHAPFAQFVICVQNGVGEVPVSVIDSSETTSRFRCGFNITSTGRASVDLWYTEDRYNNNMPIDIKLSQNSISVFALQHTKIISASLATANTSQETNIILVTDFVTQNIDYGDIEFKCNTASYSSLATIIQSNATSTTFACKVFSPTTQTVHVTLFAVLGNEALNITAVPTPVKFFPGVVQRWQSSDQWRPWVLENSDSTEKSANALQVNIGPGDVWVEVSHKAIPDVQTALSEDYDGLIAKSKETVDVYAILSQIADLDRISAKLRDSVSNGYWVWKVYLPPRNVTEFGEWIIEVALDPMAQQSVEVQVAIARRADNQTEIIPDQDSAPSYTGVFVSVVLLLLCFIVVAIVLSFKKYSVATNSIVFGDAAAIKAKKKKAVRIMLLGIWIFVIGLAITVVGTSLATAQRTTVYCCDFFVRTYGATDSTKEKLCYDVDEGDCFFDLASVQTPTVVWGWLVAITTILGGVCWAVGFWIIFYTILLIRRMRKAQRFVTPGAELQETNRGFALRSAPNMWFDEDEKASLSNAKQ